ESRSVDPSQQRASYFCAFPRLPVKQSGERNIQGSPSTPRTLPPYPAAGLHRRQNSASYRPRILPVAPANVLSSVDSPTLGHRRQPPTPPKPARSSPPPRTVFSSAAKARPLRLVQETLVNNRKRRPPVFYAQTLHSLVQSCTHITIHHHHHHHQDEPTESSIKNMASPNNNSNPIMPKVAPPLPSVPGTAVRGEGNKDRLLADLRRQLDDTASDASSVDSHGRRRRRRNKQLAHQQTGPAVIPRLAETKPVRLQLGLNLDVEIELKARLQGDVSLTLLVEKNKPSARPASSVELRPNRAGVVDEYAELFYMRVGRFSFRQRWVDREVSPSLTAAAVLLIALGGFVLGFVAGRWLDGSLFSLHLSPGVGGLGPGTGEVEAVVPTVVSVSGCEL
ncbi:hypothetical protein C8A00DRAFT_19649, partial [Chaetomidium leptoderma]